jgi:hypothetical protein
MLLVSPTVLKSQILLTFIYNGGINSLQKGLHRVKEGLHFYKRHCFLAKKLDFLQKALLNCTKSLYLRNIG